jgi:hypothetical protein
MEWGLLSLLKITEELPERKKLGLHSRNPRLTATEIPPD